MEKLLNVNISTKIIGICLLIVGLFLAAIFGVFLPLAERDMVQNRKDGLKNVVDMVYALTNEYEARIQSGELTPEDARKRAMARISKLRYAGNNYLWINDTNLPYPTMIMHPTSPALDGKVLNQTKFNCATAMQYGVNGEITRIPGKDKNLFQAMVEVTARGGEGYVSYEWSKPLPGGGASAELYPKESYVKVYKPWGWIIGSGLYMDDLYDQMRQLDYMVAGVTAGILVLALGLAWLMMRSIIRPINRIVSYTAEVAAGRFDASLGGEFRGETRQLKESVTTMVAELKQNLSKAESKTIEAAEQTQKALVATREAEEARHAAERAMADGMRQAGDRLDAVAAQMTAAAQELSAQIEESSRGAEYQKTRLDEAATAMEEMNATVLEVARNASQAAESSDKSRRKALDGAEEVKRVVGAIAMVQNQATNLKNQMADLGEKAEGIGRVMNVITDIADQTNLLALNAAIEAARAGEAGRGFAVVADEVRKLAEKTMTATKEVGEAISGIQKGARTNVEGVESSVKTIEQANQLAANSGAALDEIVHLAEVASDQVRSIAAASEQQSATTEEINRGIDDISRTALDAAEAMNQSARAVAQLSEQAQVLQDMVLELKS